MAGSELNLLAYLDNGVLSRLLKKPANQFQTQFDRLLENLCKGEKKAHVVLANSPALFLEQLSIKPKVFEPTIVESENAKAWVQNNGEAARAHFESLPELKIENFRVRYDIEKQYVTESGKGIYKSLFESKLEDTAARSFLITNLTSQAVQALPVPAKFRNEVHIQSFVAAIASHAEKMHIPFFKISSMIQKEMQRTSNWKICIPSALQKRISRSLGFHLDGDHVDADIIHFACFGYWVGQELHRTHAFTTDETEKILDRLAMYKSQIMHFRTWILEESTDNKLKELCAKFPPLEGAVHILNQDGTLNKTIYVPDLV